jgi:hypothetical protein
MEEFPPEFRPKAPVQPAWLSVYVQCKRFNCLLIEGGLLDQPIEAWQSVMAAGEAYESWLIDRQDQQAAMEISNVHFRRSILGQ